jgi:hypothetical protein
MNQKPTYLPIPVSVATEIADKFAKSQVVILAFDPVHEVTHTTTYGKSPFDKENAAATGKIVTQAIGNDLSRAQHFEDYHKDYAAANHKALIEAVREIIKQHDDWEGAMRESDGPDGFDDPLSDAINKARTLLQ